MVTVGVLLVDLLVIARRPHEPSHGRGAAGTWPSSSAWRVHLRRSAWYFFAEPHELSPNPGAEFFAGWLTEYSLSVDNLFIFIIIMSKFAVPRQYQQTALMIGIVLALIMRAGFIVVGAAAINQFSWVFYIFGLFLLYTAWKLAKEGNDDEDEYEENRLVKFAEKRLPATKRVARHRIFAKENGKRLITPMFFVVLTLGTTDLLFALDSIPAIFGLTQDPYLVFTANVFALMGLRQLYFLIGGLLQRLVYLSYGLAFLLGFIGVKLMLHAHARQRAAVHQRRRARRVGARDPDLALPRRDHRHPRRHRRRRSLAKDRQDRTPGRGPPTGGIAARTAEAFEHG